MTACFSCKKPNAKHSLRGLTYLDSEFDNLFGIMSCGYCYYQSVNLIKIIDQNDIKKIKQGLRFGSSQVCDKDGNLVPIDDFIAINYKYSRQQIYPIIHNGESIANEIPDDIKKDYNEACLVVNFSIRSAVVLLRICLERIIMHIATKCNNDKLKTQILEAKNLKRKIELLFSSQNCEELNISQKIVDMADVIREYGNDNCHSIREIQDSDTKEAFDNLAEFIIYICNDIAYNETINKKLMDMKNKI